MSTHITAPDKEQPRAMCLICNSNHLSRWHCHHPIHAGRPGPVSWKLIPPTDTSLIRAAAPWILKRNCKIMKPFLNHAMNTSCHFLPLSLAVAGQAHISIPPAMSFISSSATLRLRPSSDPCSPPPPPTPPTPSSVICALPQKPPTGHRQQDAPCHRPSLMTTKDKGPRRRGESPEKGRKRATAKV